MESLPFAGTMQFRNAAKAILGDRILTRGWTDRADCVSEKCYVKLLTWANSGVTEKEIQDIEFILWTQGVTANTRNAKGGLRGTCVLINRRTK